MTDTSPISMLASWFAAKSYGEKLFILALTVFIACYLPILAAYRGAEVVMILAFLWLTFFSVREARLRALILCDPFFLICVALLGFLMLAAPWYAYSLPPDIDPEARETRYAFKPFLIFLVALGLGVIARPYRWALVLLSMLGFAVYLLTTLGAGYWANAWAGNREDFGIHNAQHTAMFFGTALIGVVCFMSRAIHIKSAKWRRSMIILIILTLAVTVFGLNATQTRAAWLGVIVATTTGMTTTAWLTWKKAHQPADAGRRKVMTGVTLLVVLGVLIAGLAVSERVTAPLSDNHWLTVSQYSSLPEFNSDPNTSHGVRLVSWRVALEWFKERPIIGWGPGSTKDLIDQSDFFSDRFKDNFGHLHNSFIEALVANGLIGSAILLVMIIWIGYAALAAYRTGSMPADVVVFALSFFGFWTVINFFESYTLYTTGHYINAVVAGFIYSFYLQSKDKDQSP